MRNLIKTFYARGNAASRKPTRAFVAKRADFNATAAKMRKTSVD